MNAIRDAVKIVQQLRGTKNMFNYQATEVNQLYLMYMVTYKLYYSKYFHWQTKLVWILCNGMGTFLSYGVTSTGLLYGDRTDLLYLLYVGFIGSFATCVCFLIPFGMHVYSKDIETMFDRMDEILVRRAETLRRQNRQAHRIKTRVTTEILLLFVFYCIFNFVGMIDVLFFYEEHKVKNYSYYLFPLAKLDVYGNRTFYFIINILIFCATFLLTMNSLAELLFFDTWAMICHNEAIDICGDVDIASKALEKHYEKSEYSIPPSERMAIDGEFVKSLIASLKGLDDVKELINYQKQHFEILGSIILVTMFVCELAHSYIILVTDLDVAVKGKEICIYITTALVTYIVCQVGEALDNISYHTSLVTYDTPWYLVEPCHRKIILQALCQNQESVSVKLSSIYPINMNYFIRWVNLVYSSTNLLATTTGSD